MSMLRIPRFLDAKWPQVGLVAVATFLVLALWFSASAVAPELGVAWSLSPGTQAWLTMSVQLGFAVGALASGALNAADRIPTPVLIAASGLVGAASTAAIAAFATGPELALALRFLTGVAMAGVYPPGMKLVATWSRGDRGLVIGILIGAIAVGSAAPHLLAALPELFAVGAGPQWRTVLYGAAALAAAGSLLVLGLAREGPYRSARARFDWTKAAAALRDPATRLANFGYLGHMWELFAVWTWVPLLLVASYRQADLAVGLGRLAGFGMIAVGGVACIVAGALADRIGRTQVAEASLWISGACALLAGFVLDQPVALTVLCLIWGFAVIPDSAQFSAAVSELADPDYVGTALTVQTSLGFLLTVASIRVVPLLEGWLGWHAALALLALGPVFGIWSMRRLRRRPEAARLAGGRG
jgi:MFS family permease